MSEPITTPDAVATKPPSLMQRLRWWVDAHRRFNADQSNLVMHARRELELSLGKDDEHDFYGGMTRKAVLELMETFARQDHSGMSAGLVLGLFTRLAEFKPLSELSNDPAYWNEVGDGVWQSNRRADAFSGDGGLTYYTLEEGRDVVHTSLDAGVSA